MTTCDKEEGVKIGQNRVTSFMDGSSNVKEIRGTPPKFFKLLSNWRHLFDNDVIISSGRASSDDYLRWHNRFHIISSYRAMLRHRRLRSIPRTKAIEIISRINRAIITRQPMRNAN